MISPVSIFVLTVALAQCYADAPYPPPGIPFDKYGPPPSPVVTELSVPAPDAPKLEDVAISTRLFKDVITPLINIPTAPRLDLLHTIVHTPVEIVKKVLGAIPAPPRLEGLLSIHKPVGIFGHGNSKVIPIAPKHEVIKFTPSIFSPIFDEIKHIPAAPKLDIFKFKPSILTPRFEDLRNIPSAPKLSAGDLIVSPIDISHKSTVVIPAAPRVWSSFSVLSPAIHEEIGNPLGPIPTAPKLDGGLLAQKPFGLFGESDLRVIPTGPKLGDAPSVHTPIDLFGGSSLKDIPTAPKLDVIKFTPTIFTPMFDALRNIPAAPKLGGGLLVHKPVDIFGGSDLPAIPTAPKLGDILSIHKPAVFVGGSGLGVIPAAPKLGDALSVHKPADFFGGSDFKVIPAAPKLDIIKFTPTIFTPMFDALKNIPAAPKLDSLLTPLHPGIVQDAVTPFVHIPTAPKLEALKVIPVVETHFEDLRHFSSRPKIEVSKVVVPSLPEIEAILPKVSVKKVSEGPYPAPLSPYPPAVPHDVYGIPENFKNIGA